MTGEPPQSTPPPGRGAGGERVLPERAPPERALAEQVLPERVLIVTDTFDNPGDNPWLLDDLAEEFAGRGIAVDVLLNDTKGARPRGWSAGRVPGVRVLSVGVTTPRRRAGKTGAYLTGIAGLHRAWSTELRGHRYDLVLYHSIATFTGGLPLRLSRSPRVGHLICVVWDFFPIHHVQIGRIRQRWLSPVLRRLEGRSIAAADTVAVMSARNSDFLRHYHRGIRRPVIEVAPWGRISEPLRVPSRETFTVVFGGQLVAGRGVETLLQAMRLLVDDGLPVQALIVGDGADRARLEATGRTLGLTGVQFLGRMPRAQYLELIATAHVGLAATVAGVSAPTFPSKMVDYARAGLPILLALEDASDAGALVRERGCGVSVPAGDPVALAHALRDLEAEHRAGTLGDRSTASRALFDEVLSVRVAADRLLDAARRSRR